MQTTARPGVTISYTYTPLTGELATLTYSDDTPGITYTRNHLGQVTAITDAAGTRTYQYTPLDDPQTENTTGPAASTLNYTRDSYGRPAGHTLTTNGRQIATERLTYDAAGRLAALQINDLPAAGFTWRADNGQLPDTLTYPTGMTKKIAWEEHRDNMTSVEHNPYQGSFISGQTVTRDAQGRVVTLEEARVGHDTVTHTYGYNLRGELIADNKSVPADSPVTPQAYIYAYDAIGNRTQAWNSRTNFSHLYTANRLNQYTNISEDGFNPFTPVYDEEGSQTQIRTGTGNWQVTYNADNRPVTFTQGARRIENKYDHQGRRVEKALYQNGQLQKRLHFIYNGYLQIAALDTTNAAAPILLYTLHWDPTEPVATRPLVLIRPEDNGQNWYEYTHTLNKNIANLTDKTGFIVAHYDYDPYGNQTEQTEQTGPLATENPFRYSSEYHDEELGLIYYNYRHYNPKDGRWINRDPIVEKGGMNLYGFVENRPLYYYDERGLIIPFILGAVAVIAVVAVAHEIYKGVEAILKQADTVDKNLDRGGSRTTIASNMAEDAARHNQIPTEDMIDEGEGLYHESVIDTKESSLNLMKNIPNTSITGPRDFSFSTNSLDIADKIGKLYCSYDKLKNLQKNNCLVKELEALLKETEKAMKGKGYTRIYSPNSKTGYFYRRPAGRGDLPSPEKINSVLKKSTSGECN